MVGNGILTVHRELCKTHLIHVSEYQWKSGGNMIDIRERGFHLSPASPVGESILGLAHVFITIHIRLSNVGRINKARVLYIYK